MPGLFQKVASIRKTKADLHGPGNILYIKSAIKFSEGVREIFFVEYGRWDPVSMQVLVKILWFFNAETNKEFYKNMGRG